jgi:hypothetical protein
MSRKSVLVIGGIGHQEGRSGYGDKRMAEDEVIQAETRRDTEQSAKDSSKSCGVGNIMVTSRSAPRTFVE